MTSVDPLLALFTAILLLAAVPGVSVLAVVGRSATLGLRHGVAVTAGIVLADLVFVGIALFGLVGLAGRSPQGLVAAQCLGALYLAWLAVRLWRDAGDAAPSGPRRSASLLESAGTGFALTLADAKAIAFYLALLPAFLDLERPRGPTLAGMLAAIVLGLALPKLGYAWLAARSRFAPDARTGRVLGRLAAGVLLAVAAWMAADALGAAGPRRLDTA